MGLTDAPMMYKINKHQGLTWYSAGSYIQHLVINCNGKNFNIYIYVYKCMYTYIYGASWRLRGKLSACPCRRYKRCGFYPWVGKIPRGRKWKLAPVFLLGKSNGWRNLGGYSPWDRKSWTRLNDWAHTHIMTFALYISNITIICWIFILKV